MEGLATMDTGRIRSSTTVHSVRLNVQFVQGPPLRLATPVILATTSFLTPLLVAALVLQDIMEGTQILVSPAQLDASDAME